MGLRSVLERSLPLKPGEVHLSKPARIYVFSGTYTFGGKKIVDIYNDEPLDPGRRWKHPHTLEVARSRNNSDWDIVTTTIEDGFREPPFDIVNEMRNPAALKRANRIEEAARKAKKVISLAITGGLITGGLIYGVANTPEETKPGTETCEDVIDGSETLVPIGETQADHVQKLGEPVCSLSGIEYLVVDPSAQ